MALLFSMSHINRKYIHSCANLPSSNGLDLFYEIKIKVVSVTLINLLFLDYKTTTVSIFAQFTHYQPACTVFILFFIFRS